MPSSRLGVCIHWFAGAAFLCGFATGRLSADDLEAEPIHYSSSPPCNAVSRLEERLKAGKVRLVYEQHFGYLRSLLRELGIRTSSQVLVFSKTSLQRQRISPQTPRALYFSDDMYVGFCQSGEVMEVSAVDSLLGTVFYLLKQAPAERPRFMRQGEACLLCHGSSQNQGFPGHLIRSVYTDSSGLPVLSGGSYRIDQTSPIKIRWGGWYVTGNLGNQTHLGNLILQDRQVEEPVDSLKGMNLSDLRTLGVDCSKYLTPHSDVVALMVLEHQTEGHNLITRASFQTRMALHQEAALNRELGERPDHRWESTTVRIRSAGEALVKYLLFSDEARLSDKVHGTSTFAADFVLRGPRDARGRSLRDFDLEHRLFKYPCSYLIYSASFDALPVQVKDYVLRRLWDILNGRDSSKEFVHLTAADRKSILEILLATKQDLPDYWRSVSRSTTP